MLLSIVSYTVFKVNAVFYQLKLSAGIEPMTLVLRAHTLLLVFVECASVCGLGPSLGPSWGAVWVRFGPHAVTESPVTYRTVGSGSNPPLRSDTEGKLLKLKTQSERDSFIWITQSLLRRSIHWGRKKNTPVSIKVQSLKWRRVNLKEVQTLLM